MSALTEITPDDLQGMKRKQLQSLCKKYGIKANGKTEELIEQLLEYAQTSTVEGGADATNNSESENESDAEQHSETDKAAEPEKVFKVMPTTDSKPLDMEAPDSMKFVSNKEFSSMAERVTAEMEARAAAMAADQRKEVLEKYHAASRPVPETPNKSKQEKSISFDKAHDKIFSDNDSIVNHWAANRAPGTTPRNKRTNGDESAAASSKRPRLEPLFSSPAVTGSAMQSPAQRRKSTKTKAMTARARRTAAATTASAANGSKTVAGNSRVKSADTNGISATKLFADADNSANAAKNIEDSAPLSEPEVTQPESCLVAPAAEQEAKASQAPSSCEASESTVTTETIEPAQTVTAEKAEEKADPPAETKIAEAKVAEAKLLSKREVPAKSINANAAKPTTTHKTGDKKPNTLSAKPAPVPSKIGGPAAGKSAAVKPAATNLQSSTRPTLIPSSRKAPKPKAAGQPGGSQVEGNGASKKTQGIPKPTSSAAKPIAGKHAPSTVAQKPLPTHKPADYSNVQSKLKTYIHSKPKPAEKPAVPKSNTNASKLPPVSAIPKPIAGKKGDTDSGVPGYMRSTKATEIRSQKQQQEPSTKDKSGGSIAAAGNGGTKARFNPYGRPARPVPAKPSAAK